MQNFLALCASNYYDGCIFHRNIKSFMIQTGDPTGTGKGGQSMWAKPFEDEIRSTIKVRNEHHQSFPSLRPVVNGYYPLLPFPVSVYWWS
jgi:cyclophilin family peptidyl-prolyl cis-trans isomerase